MKKILSVISVLLICVTLASFLLIPAGAVPVSDEYTYRIYKNGSTFVGQIDDFKLIPSGDWSDFDVCFMLQYDDDTVALIYTDTSYSNFQLSVFQDAYGDFYLDIGSNFWVAYFDLSFDPDYPDVITGVSFSHRYSQSVSLSYPSDDYFHKTGVSLLEYRSCFLASSHPIYWQYQDIVTTSCFFYENPSDTVLVKYDDRYYFVVGSSVDQDGIGIDSTRYDPDTYYDKSTKQVFYKGVAFDKPPDDFSYDSVILIQEALLQFTVIYYKYSSCSIYRWPDLSQDPLVCYRLYFSGSAYVCTFYNNPPDEDPLGPVTLELVSSELRTSGFIFYAVDDADLRSMFLVSNQPIKWGFMGKPTSNVFFHENPKGNKLSGYNDDLGVSGVDPTPDDTDDPNDPTDLLGWIEAIYKKITSLPESIASAIGDALAAIPQAITDGLAALFVPDEEAVLSRYNYIRGKFSFVDSIISTGDYLLKFFQGLQDPDAPPVIYMDFSLAESKYDFGGKAVALDFSWYSKYKPTVDTLLSSLMWVFFAWRLFVHAPSIISGMSGSVEATVDVYNHLGPVHGKYEKPARYIGRFERSRK